MVDLKTPNLKVSWQLTVFAAIVRTFNDSLSQRSG
jgi:hypothetical protein